MMGSSRDWGGERYGILVNVVRGVSELGHLSRDLNGGE